MPRTRLIGWRYWPLWETTLIPSEEGKPGFKSLQSYGITEEVNKSLTALEDELFVTFNQASSRFFEGQTFIELSEEDRAQFLRKVISGEEFRDRNLHQKVRRLFRLVRISTFRVFYSNFPEGRIARDIMEFPFSSQESFIKSPTRTPLTGSPAGTSPTTEVR